MNNSEFPPSNFEIVCYLIIMMIIHPISFWKLIIHLIKKNHKWNAEIFNFKYHIWCAECDTKFIDELDNE